MKKFLSLILPLLAVAFNSCSKGEDIHFQINYQYSYLDFNARTSLTKYVYIDTNTEDWDYKLEYNSSETGWCEIERISSTSLKITCNVNKNEDLGRDAYIEFYINGKVYGTVNIYQDYFVYTDNELRLINAKDIIETKYEYIKFEIDLFNPYYEDNSLIFKGFCKYHADGVNLEIPILLRPMYHYSSTTPYYWDYVSMTYDPDSENNLTDLHPMRAFGSIYTGNSMFETTHSKGEFDITIYGDVDEHLYINIKLTEKEKLVKIWVDGILQK